MLRIAASAACLAIAAGAAWAEDKPKTEVGTIEVYASTPLDEAGQDSAVAPANVQSLDNEALRGGGSRSIAESMQRFNGVFRTDATGNPFQPDLFYRGYSLSPLLGLPQGMALYQDGIRINEPFGDTANLDLVPMFAIRRADLLPGSNPVFGRNTLAGALALTTKDGFNSPGLEAELSGGSYGRVGTAVGYGLDLGRIGLYGSVEDYREDGWRDYSESRVLRLFGKASWQATEQTLLSLSLSGADSRLRGNGATPLDLIEIEGREAVFTYPDQTSPRMGMASLGLKHQLSPDAEVSANAYYRYSRIKAFNGDGTEFEECEDPLNVNGSGDPYLCEEEDGDEEVVEDLAGNPVVADDDNESATQNRSQTDQDGYGLSLQWAQQFGAHRVVAGTSADFSDIEFFSDTELAALTPSRGTIGSGTRVGESVVDVHARNDSVGVFLMDTWQATEALRITLSGRWNQTTVELDDQDPSGDLSGKHRFSRFNPMLGYSYTFAPGWTTFGSLSQSTRAPTPVELTCANPDDPCRLPNGFVDDPPLDEVVTRTAELGLRRTTGRLSGSLAVFHAVSDDDIIFITDSGLTNAGYFDNVGETIRQGIEFGLNWDIGQGWNAGLEWTGLIAEFQDAFLVNSPNHPVRNPLDDDEPDPSTRQVSKGDRIPLIPRHQMRVSLGYSEPLFSIELEAVGRGSSRFRGDEANVDDHELGSFVVVNANAQWHLLPSVTLFSSVSNLFNRDYETFGVYGEADEVLGSAFEDSRRFIGPGAPVIVEAGFRLRF